MAQGKQWTKEQKDMIVQSICKYLEMGFSRNKACGYVGIAPSTLSNWVSQDEALGIVLHAAENTINTLVINNLKSAIEKEAKNKKDTKKETSKWWAERRMKEDFSTKVETDLTSSLGKDVNLVKKLVEDILSDD